MSKKNKKNLVNGSLVLGFIYALLVIFVPMIKAKPGPDPEVLTNGEKFVNFFTDNQEFFRDNGIVILLAVGLGIILVRILLKKR